MKHTSTYYHLYQEPKTPQLSIHQGGGRSGKTTGIIEIIVYISILNVEHKPIKIDIFRKHSTTIEKSVYQTFKDVLMRYNLWGEWKGTKKPLEGRFFGSEIRFLGSDDEQKIG